MIAMVTIKTVHALRRIPRSYTEVRLVSALICRCLITEFTLKTTIIIHAILEVNIIPCIATIRAVIGMKRSDTISASNKLISQAVFRIYVYKRRWVGVFL